MPSEQEWQVLVDAYQRHKTAGNLANVRVLAVTDGGGPNAIRRKELAKIWAGMRARIVVVTRAKWYAA